MDNIKLACDAASVTAIAIDYHHKGQFNWDVFSNYVRKTFPTDVAEHIETIVSNIVDNVE